MLAISVTENEQTVFKVAKCMYRYSIDDEVEVSLYWLANAIYSSQVNNKK